MIHDCSNRQAGAIDTHSRWCFNLLHASIQWITQFVGGEGGGESCGHLATLATKWGGQ